MLTLEQNQKNETVLRWLCKFSILPFEVENDFQIYSKKKCRIWYGLLGCGVIHTSYSIVQLGISIFEKYHDLKEGSSSGDILLHAAITASAVVLYNNIFMLFFRPEDRDQSARLAREIFPMAQIKIMPRKVKKLKTSTDNEMEESSSSVLESTANYNNSKAKRNQGQGGSRKKAEKINNLESMVIRKIHVKPIRKLLETNEEDEIIVLPEEPEQPKTELEEFQLGTRNRMAYEIVEEPSPTSSSFWKISRHDLLGILAGPMFFGTTFNAYLGMVYYSDSRQLLYYVLPDHLRGPVVFWFLLSLQIIAMYFMVSHGYFITLMTTLLHQRLDFRLSQIEKKLKYGLVGLGLTGNGAERTEVSKKPLSVEELKQLTMELKTVGVLMDYYNKLFCWIAFVSKTGVTAAAIFCGYFSIRFLRTDPITSIIGFPLACSCSVMITLLYDLGLSVASRMTWANKEILFQGAAAGVNCHRELCVIRSSGIKVGNFRTLSRDTTPVLINYIITETIGYVLTFR